jgi:hypothetical protein
MWKYREQASWSYSEPEFEMRLNYIAAALVSWGMVKTVQVRGRCVWVSRGGGQGHLQSGWGRRWLGPVLIATDLHPTTTGRPTDAHPFDKHRRA